MRFLRKEIFSSCVLDLQGYKQFFLLRYAEYKQLLFAGKKTPKAIFNIFGYTRLLWTILLFSEEDCATTILVNRVMVSM